MPDMDTHCHEDALVSIGKKRRSLRNVGKEPPCYVSGSHSPLDKNHTKKKSKIMSANKPQKTSQVANQQNVPSETTNCNSNVSLKDSEVIVPTMSTVGTAVPKSAHQRVKETLRMFNTYHLQLVQEEDKRVKPVGEKSTGTKPKNGTLVEKKKSRRPDLKAISLMQTNNQVLYPVKRVGSLPGIEVGDQFFSRAEMCVLGLHLHWLNGIDYMGSSFSKLPEYKNYIFPLAICIVISGMYEDDLDNSEDVIYTGQGGHDLLGNQRQIADQKMERGNLALKNSCLTGAPVRVIRGHDSKSSYTKKVYTYDGLYQVVKYWAEKGVSNFTVFKYKLRRVEGQPVLTTNEVHFTRGQIPKSLIDVRGLVCNDISGGQEKIPIPVTNVIDDPPSAPNGFEYCKSIRLSKNLKLPVITTGCKCKGDCVDPKICSCAKLNGVDFPYVRNHGERLAGAKSVVFECGPNCGCSGNCINRVSQQGLKYRLEVFKTEHKGWAVRSWDTIPPGAPICEYTGILGRFDDVNSVLDNNYIFEIDCLETMKGLDGRERRPGNTSLFDNLEGRNDIEFCIDAGRVGNVARFINHSCEPNLFVQCVLSEHHDIKMAKIMLFAADSIPPLQELCYDYGYVLDSVARPDGTIVQLPCYCGASTCRGRLY